LASSMGAARAEKAKRSRPNPNTRDAIVVTPLVNRD
jgi:hypothetical protein